jgi:hypothetical protein
MSTPSAKMSVMVGKQCACIKILGRASFASSIDFKTLVDELRQKGYDYFVLDLSLGVLAGLGLKMYGSQKAPSEHIIELFNPNPRVTELLENLGVLHLFKLINGPLNIPAGTEASTPAPATPSQEQVTRACLEAHLTLMEINPNNISKFKDVAAFLAEDLKKLKGGS